MEQVTFADVEYEGKKRRTRRELFLERMEALIPWERLEARIRPLYPKAGRGRQPYPLAALLRVHCVQLFYNLSDPGMEDMLYEIESVRRFAGLRLTGPLPDETTILNFRHLLERHGLGRGLFEEINAHLAERGYRVRAGTIVDASIIAAPSSTKNREGARDPEMHQTRKGNEWHFGMKAHIGVDAETGLVHGVRATPANTHDLREAVALLHGGEEEVWADAGYWGIEKWVDTGGRPVQWHVAMRPGRRRLLEQGGARWLRERDKASVRAKVEHPFLYVKRRFGYRKVRYRGAGQEHGTDRAAPGLREPARGRAAIRRRERPTRETSAHAGRTEGIIGQNMPVGRVFSPSSPPRPLKPAPSVPHRPQKGLAQSFPSRSLKR